MAHTGKNPRSEAKGAAAQNMPDSKKGGISLNEGSKKFLFAALALAAIATVAFVFLFMGQSDPRSEDGSEFYYSLVSSPSAAIIYDVRGVSNDAQQSAVYQCGVDMIYRGRFVGKALSNIACDSGGCLSTTTQRNGSSPMTYDSALRSVSGVPYILIKPGAEPGYAFFKRHIEIYIGPDSANGSSKCDLSATES